MSSLISIQFLWYSDGIPKEFFENVNFEKICNEEKFIYKSKHLQIFINMLNYGNL